MLHAGRLAFQSSSFTNNPETGMEDSPNEYRLCWSCGKRLLEVGLSGVCRKCNHRLTRKIKLIPRNKTLVPLDARTGKILDRASWFGLQAKVKQFYLHHSDKKINDENVSRSATTGRGPNVPYSRNGHVYLLRSENGYFKIGRSTDIEKRVKNLQREFPIKIVLVAAIPTESPPSLERELHGLFSEKRLSQHEWFSLNDEDVEYITGLANGSSSK